MIPLNVADAKDRPIQILCIGAHSDDIEIGCGGTLIRLLESIPVCEVLWVVLSANAQRAAEARRSADLYLSSLSSKEIIVENFRDGFFPYLGTSLKEYFEALKPKITPDLVFTHYRNDLHQDHRTVAELTWNTFRDHFILEYEIFKYDGDLGTPNMFVPLESSVCDQKIKRLKDCFKSQEDNSWFNERCFKALLSLRGIEANSRTCFAEAFFSRKSVLAFD